MIKYIFLVYCITYPPRNNRRIRSIRILKFSKNIKNAGAIFIGSWSPEASGDYLAGPNHTLPTSGTARFAGALGVETFMKNTSLIEFSKEAFYKTKNDVIELAQCESLHSHAESIKRRN